MGRVATGEAERRIDILVSLLDAGVRLDAESMKTAFCLRSLVSGYTWLARARAHKLARDAHRRRVSAVAVGRVTLDVMKMKEKQTMANTPDPLKSPNPIESPTSPLTQAQKPKPGDAYQERNQGARRIAPVTAPPPFGSKPKKG